MDEPATVTVEQAPEAAAVEAAAEGAEAVAEEQTAQVEATAEAAVEIAQIEADRDVAIAETFAANSADQDRLARIETWLEAHGDPNHPELRAEIAELRQLILSLSSPVVEVVEATPAPAEAASAAVSEPRENPVEEVPAAPPERRKRYVLI